MPILIADSGSTKCEWSLVSPRTRTSFFTQGMSPYFLSEEALLKIIDTELYPQLPRKTIDAVHFYGTGTRAPENTKKIKRVLQQSFAGTEIKVENDLTGAARALCQHEKGIACILGTGSNSGYYDGKKIRRNSPGIGFILGDEGSGACLGKQIVQHYLYDIFEKDLKEKFDEAFHTDAAEILDRVYRQPLPNRYLAAFTTFLSANRGHYMIENIIEDGLNDFFFQHVRNYPESRYYPVHFTGSIAWYFRDVVQLLCEAYGLHLGTILKNPMDGLVRYHKTELS